MILTKDQMKAYFLDGIMVGEYGDKVDITIKSGEKSIELNGFIKNLDMDFSNVADMNGDVFSITFVGR